MLGFIELCFNTISPGSKYYNTWHIRVIADMLQAAFSGKITRVIVNMPPRSMKSTCISVVWPAWILGLQPTARIIVASYSQILSLKHSLDTRCILQSDWYKALFPEVKLAQDQNTQYKFQTTQRGFRFATSVGGTMTGEGGDFLIVDDPLTPVQATSERFRKRAAEWFDQTFATRLNDRKKGVIVVVMHRLHPDDLTGHLLAKPGNIWHHLCLPMISEKKQTIYSLLDPLMKDIKPLAKLAYERQVQGTYGTENRSVLDIHEDLSTGVTKQLTTEVEFRKRLYTRKKGELLLPLDNKHIKQIKIELGTYAFAAQYQQNPLDQSQNIIKSEWLKRYRNYPDLSYVTQSWDTANTQNKDSDFSVCTTWAKADNMFYLLHLYRGKLEYPALKKQVLSLSERWNPHAILIEARASGQQLVQELKVTTALPIITIMPPDDKVTRFHQIIPLIESGRIFLPHNAAWLSDFEHEILMFPKTAHDDQVDSMTQYLNWARATDNRPSIRYLY